MKNSYYIDIHVVSINELLLPHGSPSFTKNKLNSEAEKYIFEAASGLPRKKNIHIRIFVSGPQQEPNTDVSSAIHSHFDLCEERVRKKLSTILQRSWKFLLVAIVFLIVMIVLSHLFIPINSTSGLFVTLREILIILGWVALWRPADILLYEWIPYRREIAVFKKLKQAEVEIIMS
jgi:hypothetical protein